MNKNPFSLLGAGLVDDHSVLPVLSKKQLKKQQQQKKSQQAAIALALPENTNFKYMPKELLAKVFYYLESWKRNACIRVAVRVCKQWHSALAFLRLDNMHLKETCLNSYLFLQKFGTVPAISVNLDFFPFFAHFCPEDAVENTERLTLIFDQSSEVKGAWKGREKRPVNRNGRRNQEENNGEFLMPWNFFRRSRVGNGWNGSDFYLKFIEGTVISCKNFDFEYRGGAKDDSSDDEEEGTENDEYLRLLSKSIYDTTGDFAKVEYGARGLFEPVPKDRIYIIANSNEHAMKIKSMRAKILENFDSVMLMDTPAASKTVTATEMLNKFVSRLNWNNLKKLRLDFEKSATFTEKSTLFSNVQELELLAGFGATISGLFEGDYLTADLKSLVIQHPPNYTNLKLNSFTSLVYLNLFGKSDKTFMRDNAKLALPGLRHLVVNCLSPEIRDFGIMSLIGCTSLETFEMSGVPFEVELPENLKNLTMDCMATSNFHALSPVRAFMHYVRNSDALSQIVRLELSGNLLCFDDSVLQNEWPIDFSFFVSLRELSIFQSKRDHYDYNNRRRLQRRNQNSYLQYCTSLLDRITNLRLFYWPSIEDITHLEAFANTLNYLTMLGATPDTSQLRKGQIETELLESQIALINKAPPEMTIELLYVSNSLAEKFEIPQTTWKGQNPVAKMKSLCTHPRLCFSVQNISGKFEPLSTSQGPNVCSFESHFYSTNFIGNKNNDTSSIYRGDGYEDDDYFERGCQCDYCTGNYSYYAPSKFADFSQHDLPMKFKDIGFY